jgi:hypothetical protein
MGAVSPAARAIASSAPLTMPEIAAGSTTVRMVRHFRAPSARLAWRSSSGTRRSISSLDRITTGSIRQASASAPARPLCSVDSTTAV